MGTQSTWGPIRLNEKILKVGQRSKTRSNIQKSHLAIFLDSNAYISVTNGQKSSKFDKLTNYQKNRTKIYTSGFSRNMSLNTFCDVTVSFFNIFGQFQKNVRYFARSRCM